MEELEESWQLLFDADKNVEIFLQKHQDKNPAQRFLMDKQQAVLEYKQYLYAREVTVFNKIKEIFISHFGLAEPSTRENYRAVVRFIENRNIINVTERKLDITFTGEDVSGLRDRIASLFRNLTDINSQIRNQLESGEPRTITPLSTEASTTPLTTSHSEKSTPAILRFDPTKPVLNEDKPETSNVQSKEKDIAFSPGQKTSNRQNWPGRYTLLTNKASLDLTHISEDLTKKDASKSKTSESMQVETSYASSTQGTDKATDTKKSD